MTTEPKDEGNANPEIDNLNQQGPELADFVEDIDPMIEEMKAAEAEIAKGNGSQPAAPAEGKAPEATPEAPAAAPKDKPGSGPAMIPKARLDEVLSERDLLRDQVGYLRGLHDAKAPAATVTSAQPAKAPDQPAGKPADQGVVVDEIETAITAAEGKKLALAERYDNGEISSKQWKQEEILIDKEIRGLSDKRLDKVREDSRNEAQAVVTANNFESVKNNLCVQLQAKNPNVAFIDSLSPGQRDGIWKDITDDAIKNLAAQGVKVSDANPQSKLLLIQEKARLTNDLSKYGFKPAAPATPAPVVPTGQPKGLSETAQNRKAKIELANSQPPSITDMGNGANNGEITEADIENMNEDQMADLLQKAPHLVQRLLGGTQNRG